MKKIIVTLLLICGILLSGCAAADEEPQDEELYFSNYSYLTFDWNTMTFSGLERHDILYGVSDPYEDFVILNVKYKDMQLTTEQQIAYERTFELFDMLDASSGFTYGSLDEYSTQNIKDFSDSSEIVLTATDLITFNSIKSEAYMLKSTASSSTSYTIGKISYVEQRLERVLTTDEKISLQALQEQMNYLYNKGVNFDLSTGTFEELILEIESKRVDDVSQEDLARLEMAFLIIKQLHDDE